MWKGENLPLRVDRVEGRVKHSALQTASSSAGWFQSVKYKPFSWQTFSLVTAGKAQVLQLSRLCSIQVFQ